VSLGFALSGYNVAAQPDMGGDTGGGPGGPGGGMGGMGGMGRMGGLRALMGDPAQRAETQVEALRDSLAVTNDQEWDVISPMLLKVVQLKSEISTAELSRMMNSMMSSFMGGGAGGMGGAAGMGGGMAALSGMGGIAGMLGVQPDPTADALRQTLNSDGTAAQVKAALAKFRAAKAQKLAELTKAQDALKGVLSVRQEATLALAGYLE
jgi:hypothetical protein